MYFYFGSLFFIIEKTTICFAANGLIVLQ